MRQTRNIARHLFVLALTLVGLMSWSTLPPRLSGRAAQAATRTGLTTPPVQATSRAAANGRIAFASSMRGSNTGADIYTINADGSDRRRLTFDPKDDIAPVWSPDGTKIAFVRFRVPEPGEIFVMNADGSDQRRLTESGGIRYYLDPTWSPDGTKIAVASFTQDGDGVTVMNADGSDQRTIFLGRISYPAWSPDSLKLAGSRDGGLVLFSIDGGNLTQITQPPQPFDPATYYFDTEPAWSPDGSKIVFERFLDCDFDQCNSTHLYVINPDGSNLTELVRPNLGYSPAWSPDGRRIVFGGSDLYVINADGSGLTNLTNTNDQYEGGPAWQPLSLSLGGNPIDDPQFFVRQHYLDFLAREPEQSGLDAWLRVLHDCPSGDAECLHQARLTTSAAFFGSPEFQLKGFFVFRFYSLAFDRLPTFAEISADMQDVSGSTPAEVYANKATFTDTFDQRYEFGTRFAALSNANYVTALLSRYGLTGITTPDPAQPDGAAKVTLTPADLVARLDNNSLSRVRVLRAIADSDEVFQLEYNKAFVAMQYYGYLRRAPEAGGYNAWLNYLNAHPSDSRTMVRGFVDSVEYRARFGQP